jgi:hypothetical protein
VRATEPIRVSSPSPSPPPTNALQALVSASQAPTFEVRVRKSRAEDSIVAPPEGSEHATAAASEAPEAATETDEAKNVEELEAFDAYLMDNYDGLDFKRIPKYQLPVKTHKY